MTNGVAFIFIITHPLAAMQQSTSYSGYLCKSELNLLLSLCKEVEMLLISFRRTQKFEGGSPSVEQLLNLLLVIDLLLLTNNGVSLLYCEYFEFGTQIYFGDIDRSQRSRNSLVLRCIGTRQNYKKLLKGVLGIHNASSASGSVGKLCYRASPS